MNLRTKKLDSKRIMMFTRREHPHENNRALEVNKNINI